MFKQIDFIVIDDNTSKQADISEIALKEDWAKGLMYCDMEGFAINENGQLVLLDECGNFTYCPYDRFTVKFENSVVLSREEYEKINLCYNITRKETAREILKWLTHEDNVYELNPTVTFYYTKKEFEELAKQFGVDLGKAK